VAPANISSVPARLLFRVRHGNLLAHFRTGWLRFCGVNVGKNTVVPRISITWPHQVQIGRHCVLEPDIFFKFDGIWCPGPSIIIGDNVFIGRGCEFNIKKSIRLGNYCLIGSGAKFIDHDHGIRPGELIGQQHGPEAPIVIGSDVWIGDNVVVLKGVAIGDGAVIGAGAIVTKDIAPLEIWAGIPARKIGARQ
jgi:acetyltransferase-like isoleucine patch superfamily enzyme